MFDEFPPKFIDQMVASLQPSIDVIEQAVAKGSYDYVEVADDYPADSVARNVNHLETTTARPQLKGKYDEAKVAEAIALGKDFISKAPARA